MDIEKQIILFLNQVFSFHRGFEDLTRAKSSPQEYFQLEIRQAQESWGDFGGYDLKGKEVLDVGCGLGGGDVFFLSQGVKRVTGMDIITDHLVTALDCVREYSVKADGRLCFVTGDAASMPFAGDSFDLVVSFYTFEHLAQPEKALSECQRVVKAGGIVCVSFPPYYSPWGGHLTDWIRFPWCQVLFSEKALLRAVEKIDRTASITGPFAEFARLSHVDTNPLSYLNKLTVKGFSQMVQGRKGRISLAPIGDRYGSILTFFFRLVSWVSPFRELFTSRVIYTWEKPFPSGNGDAMEEVGCAVCGSREAIPLYRGKDRLHGIGGDFTLVRCPSCRLIYLNPRPTQEGIRRYYPREYEPFQEEASSPLVRWDHRYGLEKLRKAITRWKQGDSILDIGCATGFFLQTMVEAGWKAYGVERDEDAAQWARRTGSHILVGGIEEVSFPENSFDVVTMWNVLEHLHQPLAAVDKIHRLLKKEGLLVIAVPNPSSLDALVFGSLWVGLDVPRHLYVFPIDFLARVLAQKGFRLLETRCLQGSHRAFALSVGFAIEEKVRGKRMQATINWVIYCLPVRLALAPLFYLVDRLKRGPVITLICQKV